MQTGARDMSVNNKSPLPVPVPVPVRSPAPLLSTKELFAAASGAAASAIAGPTPKQYVRITAPPPPPAAAVGVGVGKSTPPKPTPAEAAAASAEARERACDEVILFRAPGPESTLHVQSIALSVSSYELSELCRKYGNVFECRLFCGTTNTRLTAADPPLTLTLSPPPPAAAAPIATTGAGAAPTADVVMAVAGTASGGGAMADSDFELNYAYVQFYSVVEARRARSNIKGLTFHGHKLRAKIAQPLMIGGSQSSQVIPLPYLKCVDVANHFLGATNWSCGIVSVEIVRLDAVMWVRMREAMNAKLNAMNERKLQFAEAKQQNSPSKPPSVAGAAAAAAAAAAPNCTNTSAAAAAPVVGIPRTVRPRDPSNETDGMILIPGFGAIGCIGCCCCLLLTRSRSDLFGCVWVVQRHMSSGWPNGMN